MSLVGTRPPTVDEWDKWHVNFSAGIQRLPMEAIREKYVEPWIKAFPNAMFLMRRPFSHASKHGMGLYNDMTGESGETEWLAFGKRTFIWMCPSLK